MSKNKKQFSKFSSKVLRINIELSNYKFFHSPSLIEQNDDRFLGRKNIIERLKNILTKNEPNTGAYLITGYRGMGKSSYVNKVLNQITLKKRGIFSRLLQYGLLLFLISLFTTIGISIYLTAIVFIIDFLFSTNTSYRFIRNSMKAMFMLITHNGWSDFLFFLKNKLFKINVNYENLKSKTIELINKRKRVVLKLNLGHEILNEKDILSLIAKNIEKEFKKFAYSFRRQSIFYILKITLLIFLTSQIVNSEPLQLSVINSNLFPTQKKEFKNSSEFDKEKYLKLISEQSNAKTFLKVINLVDIYCDCAYCYLSNKAINILPFRTNNFPTHLNYLFLAIFFLLNFFLTFLIQCIFRSNYTRYTCRKGIIKKLRQLNEHIDSAVKTELNSGIGITESKIGLNFNHRRAKEYPMASIRQIEKSLIDIFDEIDQLVFPILRPEFIIVFDELDKIDPQSNTNINEKEEELTDFEYSTSGFAGGAATRLRKQNVLKLLANMKYFITSAKAKFIFISGRELYDAFLADVSDREFSISSIFHEVIYVESFLSDSSDNNKADIISMTEHYVCQFIIPEWFIIYKTYQNGTRIETLTIKTYEEYLKKILKLHKNENEVNKIIMLLYQFVHYLTHVSNGAPKKITNLFERHLITPHNKNRELDYFVGNRNREFYLSFGYLDQCKIGFIHYLANPIIMAIVNNVHLYGDKLLVSAAFLIDHIYKFHRNGFSWRNLEHAPEILDINHTPELRNFISTIISYLTQTHISTIVSGLYVFKFPKKISEEISFISRMSEEASAIFNFTLDESLSVKRHYSKLLQHFTKQYNSEKQYNLKEGEIIHTIADIHHIMGDLHLLDEEYTDAIFDYQNCIQNISRDFKDNYDSHQITHLLFIIRTMLKLGLAFEKRKTFNSAYLAYCELVSMAIDFRYINEDRLGLDYGIENGEGWIRQKANLYKSDGKKRNAKNTYTKETKPERLDELDKNSIIFSASGDELIPNLAWITTPLKNKIITRLSLFEDIRLMYQALLAKLFVLEKHQLGGIAYSNLEVIEGEFLNLHLTTNLKDKFLISTDFFKKLGDIMYYKNGLITKESSNLFNGLDFWGYDVNNDIEAQYQNIIQKNNWSLIKKIPFKDFKVDQSLGENFKERFKNTIILNVDRISWVNDLTDKKLISELSKAQVDIQAFFKEGFCQLNDMTEEILNKVNFCNIRRRKLLENRSIAPCHACKYYNRSLKILADNLLHQENDLPETKALIFLKALDEPEKFYSFRSNFSLILASTLGGFGDVLISCSMEDDSIGKNFLEAFFTYIKSKNKEKDRYKIFFEKVKTKPLSPLEKALIYYLASAKYYKRSSNLKEAHIMYKKILMLFIQYVLCNPEGKETIKIHLKDIDKQIVKRIIQCIYSAYEHIHVVEIQKLKWNKTQEMYEKLDLKQLSLFPELEETIYAYYELQILCGNIPFLDKEITETNRANGNISIEKLRELQALSPFRLNSSIYNRLISLRFKVLLNRKLLEKNLTDYNFEENVYLSDHPVLFYAKLNNSLSKEIYPKYFLNKVEHYILDSIFCLQKFIEIVYPHNKTTLFTNSYVADIYKQLFEWSQLFDFLFMLYAYMDDNYPVKKKYKISKHKDIIKLKKDDIRKKLTGHCLKRYEVENKINDTNKSENYKHLMNVFNFDKSSLNEEVVKKNIITDLKDGKTIDFSSQKDLFTGRTQNIFDQLIQLIDKSNTHLINSNYLAEVGIKKYQSSFAMHQEGKPYKSMMEEMYFLNDDLDNDSYKFFLALERYRINVKDVYINMKKLKNVYNNSQLFDINNYVNSNLEENDS